MNSAKGLWEKLQTMLCVPHRKTRLLLIKEIVSHAHFNFSSSRGSNKRHTSSTDCTHARSEQRKGGEDGGENLATRHEVGKCEGGRVGAEVDGQRRPTRPQRKAS